MKIYDFGTRRYYNSAKNMWVKQDERKYQIIRSLKDLFEMANFIECIAGGDECRGLFCEH